MTEPLTQERLDDIRELVNAALEAKANHDDEAQGEWARWLLSQPLIPLLDEVERLRAEKEALIKAIEKLIELCEVAADFSNGVTHQGMDEGRILAWEQIDEVKAIKDRIKYSGKNECETNA